MKRIHFIAIGGAVMHQLAMALQRQGNIVTGSDDEINDPAKTNLKQAGLLPEASGWYPEKITSDIDAIVLGMHAKANNPELIAAQQLNIPIYSFPEYVYEVSREKQRIVIAGSHGKTTITSMILHVLRKQGMEFDYLVGAKLAGFDSSVQLSDAPVIILEGDEYPASVIEKRPKIFFYHPHVSVLSGIAWDHINVFPTYENYRSQFETYLVNMTAGARLIYNAEDKEVDYVVNSSAGHLDVTAYQMPAYRYEDGLSVITTADGDHTAAVFGSHNLLNMQAALKVCNSLGISEALFYESIADFTGAARRLEKVLEQDQLVMFRDFAHAPSKLSATLNAIREVYPDRHLVACFELHTYSSLNEQFLKEYAHSMDAPDTSIVYYSYHALHLKGLPALQPETVKSFFERDDLTVIDNKDQLKDTIANIVAKSEKPLCLLMMSSGSFDGIDWNNVVSRQD